MTTWTKKDCLAHGCSLAFEDLDLVSLAADLDPDGLSLFSCKACGKRWAYDGYYFRPPSKYRTMEKKREEQQQ